MFTPRTTGCTACVMMFFLLCLCRLRRHWWHSWRNCLLTTVRRRAHFSRSYGFTCQRPPYARPLSTSTSISLGLTSTARSTLPRRLPSVHREPKMTCFTKLQEGLRPHCTRSWRSTRPFTTIKSNEKKPMNLLEDSEEARGARECD